LTDLYKVIIIQISYYLIKKGGENHVQRELSVSGEAERKTG
jgi:hypothetical protein